MVDGPSTSDAADRLAEVYGRTGEPPEPPSTPHLVVVGAAARDVTADDPRGWRLGGGAPYSALLGARLGARTAVVLGVDELAATATEIDLLHAAGVETVLVPLERGPVFENIEQPSGRVQYCRQPSDRIDPSAVPETFRAAPAWLIVPVAGETDASWATVPAGDAFVALGWQGLLRELAAGERVRRRQPTASALLERADLVGVSHHDVDPTMEVAALLGFLRPGGQLVITKGAEGGLVMTRRQDGSGAARRYPSVAPDQVVDATGAGDTFLAALVATHLMPEFAGVRRRGGDLRFAAAAGSLVVEGHGLAGVPDLAAVVQRARRSLAGPPPPDEAG